MTKLSFPHNLDLDIGEGEELKLIFKELPLKISFPQFHLLAQKVTKSLENSFDNVKSVDLDSDMSKFFPVLTAGISGLMNNLDIMYLQDFFKVHQNFIEVIGEKETIKLNEIFHLKGRPDLKYLIIIKIIEVYYKNFFIGLLKNLNLMERINKVTKVFQKSTGISGKSTLKKGQTQK